MCFSTGVNNTESKNMLIIIMIDFETPTPSFNVHGIEDEYEWG